MNVSTHRLCRKITPCWRLTMTELKLAGYWRFQPEVTSSLAGVFTVRKVSLVASSKWQLTETISLPRIGLLRWFSKYKHLLFWVFIFACILLTAKYVNFCYIWSHLPLIVIIKISGVFIARRHRFWFVFGGWPVHSQSLRTRRSLQAKLGRILLRMRRHWVRKSLTYVLSFELIAYLLFLFQLLILSVTNSKSVKS